MAIRAGAGRASVPAAALLAVVLAAVLATLLAGCAKPRPSSGTAGAATPAQLPVGARFDYQIGGAYPPGAGVQIVDRDRQARPAPGRYNICYVNAFQAQTDELAWWRHTHRGLLLHDSSGAEVIDRNWHEVLLDIGTAAKRRALAAVIGRWMAGCAHRGFQAVEPDNLDSYTRSKGLLHARDAVAYAGLLSARAHRDGLLIAQKNAAELSRRRAATGFDFAIAEECQVYRECGSYTRTYGRAVIEIEYTDNGRRAFRQACALRGSRISVELVDRDVRPPRAHDHLRRWCG